MSLLPECMRALPLWGQEKGTEHCSSVECVQGGGGHGPAHSARDLLQIWGLGEEGQLNSSGFLAPVGAGGQNSRLLHILTACNWLLPSSPTMSTRPERRNRGL